jgi:glycosyltransferase involved in cell wall biosynthesis
MFASHHIVVAPYKTASQSAIVPLGQAAGRPVVATDVGGLAETVSDGVDGILTPAGNAQGFADGIRRAAGMLEELARNTPAKVSSWDTIAALVVARGTPE